MILEASNIKRFYEQSARRLEVLKGIDLNIGEGEVLAIAGPSGAGKSTLLHILGGLDSPNEGRIRLDGDDLYQVNDRRRAHIRNEKVGFIFQFYHLLPEFSALENVCLPLLVKEDAQDIKRFKERGTDLLAKVGLKERVHHKPNELSGGEQQRVAIARALINKPKILLCDEPTGNLDSQTGEEIINLLLTLNKENKQTLVVVTHDEGLARLSGRVVHMRDGKLMN
ncbi:MAG TPA: ABC transporter ATP-binding protein [Candidatus Omnitrophota bacterium]|nr:ABC transporter ATP-binding protein [Candidatus Omnitrophota bacterium]